MKTFIVSAGAQGIGKAIVQLLLKQGHQVVFVDCDDEAGKLLIRENQEAGDRLRFVCGDASNVEVVQKTVDTALFEFHTIDGLVNNVGVGSSTNFFDLGLEEWQKIIDINLTSTFLFSQKCAFHMKEKGGTIVNIASTRAFMSEPNTIPYSATKGAIIALTHSLAVTLGQYHIRVNCISPGWIDTRAWQKNAHDVPPLRVSDHTQHPVQRVGTPLDIAHAVAYLMSDEAGFITGTNLTVDGGMTIKMIYEVD